MKKTLFKKILTKILLAIIFCTILGIVILNSTFYFINLLSIFSVLYLLIGWINYLKLDRLTFLISKNKEKYIENDEFVSLDITPEAYGKLSILSYLISGIILILISLLLYEI